MTAPAHFAHRAGAAASAPVLTPDLGEYHRLKALIYACRTEADVTKAAHDMAAAASTLAAAVPMLGHDLRGLIRYARRGIGEGWWADYATRRAAADAAGSLAGEVAA